MGNTAASSLGLRGSTGSNVGSNSRGAPAGQAFSSVNEGEIGEYTIPIVDQPKRTAFSDVHIPQSPGNDSVGSDMENSDPNDKLREQVRQKMQVRTEGFTVSKRKGGKRPPRDPTVSREERLAQARVQHCQASFGLQQQQQQQGSLVDFANRVSVADLNSGQKHEFAGQLANDIGKPQRRLRPKAPSSTCSPLSGVSESSLSSNSETDQQREPVTLRSFDILKVLGKGSHGKVYLVRHKQSGKLYAMKELKKSEVIRSKQLDNTKREFRVHRLLVEQEIQCPNITPLRFAFHSRSRLYMVFDYCAGGELYFHIGQRGRLPEALARFYGAQMALAIGYLHSNSVAYRDLKPENLMLDAEGNIHLVDLGLCKDGMTSATSGSSSFCGTVEYLAPEILNYQEHGLAVDWWSYGMVLFEMLTGLPPWYSYKQDEVVQGILKGNLEFPAFLSNDAKDLISKLLDRNPARRMGSGKGVEDLIDHPFFASVDWVALARSEVTPPFTPPSDSNSLACNFDQEFTNSKINTEHDYLPPSSSDPFGRFYYDSEDPVNC